MSPETIWLVFRIFVVFGLAVIFLCIICMGIYDVQKAKEVRRLRRDRSYRYINHFRRKPSVTILVPAYNESLVVERCLSSIIDIKYKRFQIVVVNDGSKDNTAQKVRQFISRHPKANIRLVDLKQNRGKGGALNYVLKHYCDTELIMVLDADCTIRQDALNKAVEYFKDPKVMGLATHVRIAARPRVLSYLQKIEHLVGYRHKKYASVTNSEFIIGGQGATYRTEIVKRVGGFDERMFTEDIALSLSIANLGNKDHKLVYASDVITYTEAPPTVRSLYKQRYRWKIGGIQAIYAYKNLVFSSSKKHSKMLTQFRLPQALASELSLIFEPLLLFLFVTIAISTHSLSVFFGGWFTLTVYTLFIILVDEYSTKSEKLLMMLIMPFMYPFFYLLTIINVVALFNCIVNWRQIIGKETTRGTWVSPTRIGHQITG